MYDPECETLAEHFLGDEPYTKATEERFERRIRSLAQAIQDAVEAWLTSPANDTDVDPVQ